jgi:predicted MPP superfamily phosphohydrolase
VAAVFTLYVFPLAAAARKLGGFNPSRRRALKAGSALAIAAPASVAAFAFITRDNLNYREADIPLTAHAAALNGLRIVQLTDIHMGAFVSERLVRRAVGIANEFNADLAFVTGDLISTKGDPLDSCLKIVSGLRATAGIYGCNGNHEIYAEAEQYVTDNAPRLGIRILRGEAIPLQFNGATINLAGTDYQRRGSRYLEGAEQLIAPGAYNLLLSHNPDLVPVAAAKGFDLTVSGHTHGGQVTLEVLHPSLNIVRFTTPYVHGLYEKGGSRLYVSRGIGTIGVPARLGAPPEVVCLRLCATSS